MERRPYILLDPVLSFPMFKVRVLQLCWITCSNDLLQCFREIPPNSVTEGIYYCNCQIWYMLLLFLNIMSSDAVLTFKTFLFSWQDESRNRLPLPECIWFLFPARNSITYGKLHILCYCPSSWGCLQSNINCRVQLLISDKR